MTKIDFVDDLGCLGFTMRLKRLSDALIHDGRRLYKELGMDIEPNWYVIFRLLRRDGPRAVTEIADLIGMAHPSVIAITNKMIRRGYLRSVRSPRDQRRRELELTTKSLEKMDHFEKIWKAGEQGVIRALEGTNSMELIRILEQRYRQKGFKDRTLDELRQL